MRSIVGKQAEGVELRQLARIPGSLAVVYFRLLDPLAQRVC
jgi:hypothetical protein